MQRSRMWWMARAAAVAAIAAASLGAGAATPVPSGNWSFVFTDAKGHPERPIRVYTYRPRACDSKCPIVFVMSGVKRDASHYRDDWTLIADRYKVLVVAPEFSQQYWPGAAQYNLGGVEGEPNREKWTYSAIEHLFDEVRDGQAGYRIFGHSAGGQFVERMTMLLPGNRATLAMAANPGWHLMPEWRSDKAADSYPYSFVGAPGGEASLRQALTRRFVLLLGQDDTDPESENLNETAGAKRQGASRLERGENFFKAATAAAQELHVTFAWQLEEAPNTAHDGAAMGRYAADTEFGKP